MRLTRGGWFLLGFGLTIAFIWAGANVWTLFKERENSNHLTKIERIVVGLNRARKVPAQGSDAGQPADAGQQPSPSAAPAGPVHVGHGEDHQTDGAGHSPTPGQPQPATTPTSHSTPGGPTTPTPSMQGGAQAPPTVEPSPTTTAPGLLEVPSITVGETPCPVNALGIRVCTE